MPGTPGSPEHFRVPQRQCFAGDDMHGEAEVQAEPSGQSSVRAIG